MNNDKKWRQFEKLVARIEKALAPKGAIVKSPDYVVDILTGSRREVDASIRMSVGSVQILITVECRDRDAVQDVTWIEQLGTKRRNIGAAKTIAVSASGFSQPAQIAAKLEGIELRTLREMSDKDIANWLPPIELTLVILNIKLNNISAELRQGDNTLIHEFSTKTFPDLTRVEDKQPISSFHIFKLAADANPIILQSIKLDGKKEKRTLIAKLPNDSMQIAGENTIRFVKSITFELECNYETKKEKLTNGNRYEYIGDQGIIAKSTEFLIYINGLPIIVHISIPNPKTD